MTQIWNTAAKEPGELIHRLKAIGQDSIALTDHGTTSGWVRFDKACHKNGIKPIFGVEGYFCPSRFQKGLTEEQKLLATRGLSDRKDIKAAVFKMEKQLGLSKRAHFCAWAMNKKGIHEILWSTSKAYIEGFYHRPRWDWDLIKNMKNCIFGSACMGGVLNWKIIQVLEKKLPSSELPIAYREALEEARRWRDELGDRFYIEIMGVDLIQQPKINYLMYKIATELSIPIIATQDPHYVKAEDWETHDILLAMNSTRYDKLKDALTNPTRMRYEAHDLYIKSAEEMYKDLLARNPKIPPDVILSSIERTQEIVGRCEGELIKKSMIMPKLDFPNPKGLPYKEAMKDRLVTLVQDGWGRKVAPFVTELKQPLYLERIKEELKLICTMGFAPYFILCNDLMKWVDSVGIERGPARGSSCGSLVAYLLDITMIDPIPHNLLFSRFIDPNRSDFPDVDMDFQDDRRREVVEYFIKKYGRNNVAVLGANSQFKAKMVLKDVARLYNVPLSETQAVCNLVLERSGADSRMSFCLTDTLAQQDEAKLYDRKYPEVFKYAALLEGRMKNISVHAAGVIIGDGDIRKYTALRVDKKDKELWVSMIDKHDAEDIGLLKMDVLGLNTMAVINEAKMLVKECKGKTISLEGLIQDVTYNGGDKAVYKEFELGNTAGIFQFNTPGLKRLSMQIKVDKFSELSDAVSLMRPGPIHSGAAANYPALKFKLAKVEKFEHEVIENWTRDTHGLIIYQEQVMQIVRELGDFNWAQTNTVRKVMSKSGGAEYFMKTFWPQWKIGCNAKGMDDALAEKAFKRILSFGSWCFNKSHGVAYAFVSYISMWLKVHYPVEFCTAYLNKVTGGENREKNLKAMIKEAERLGIKIREADVNVSKDKFVIDEKGNIVAGLSDIKTVGGKAVSTIVENQPYTSLVDFMSRIDNRACNKRAVENLIKSGAFNRFNYDNKKLLENLEYIQAECKKKNPKAKLRAEERLNQCKGASTFTAQEEAELKVKSSPINIGKHLSEFYPDVLKKLGKHIKITKLIDIELDEGAQQSTEIKRTDVWVLGVITSVDLKRLSQEVKEVIDTSFEQRYALCNLEDETDFIVLSFKGNMYNESEQKLFGWKDRVMLIHGTVNVGWKKIYVNKVIDMEGLRAYIKNDHTPYNFDMEYLFQHPLHFYFNRVGGVGVIRKKYDCKPLVELKKLKAWKSLWALGVVTEIRSFKLKRGEMAGQDFYWIIFEDDTFQGVFMVFPNDPRFEMMKRDLFRLHQTKAPFLLLVQKDMKYDPLKPYEQVSISIDKRTSWDKVIKMPFKFKGLS
jgi:DNA polymerase-3 subunit alpha